MALAQQLVANAPLSLRNFKEMAYRSLDMSESATAAFTMRIYDQLLLSEDAKEGPRAFAEKRPPQWQGPIVSGTILAKGASGDHDIR
jgi:enoyl-CoA hydratase